MIFQSSTRGKIAFFLFAFLFSTLPVFAQDEEPVVIDEVVAQVNDGVITLSRVRREAKNVIEVMVQQQKKTPEEAQREVDAKRPELIANLINEELLLQQGKEMGLEQEVEQGINQEFVQIMKQIGVKTLEDLYKKMREEGVDPDELRASKRKEYTKFLVLRYEVQGKIYNSLTSKEVRDYYDKNKDKFKTPEKIALSELFLNFAGRTSTEAVTAEALAIIKKARAGADFKALVAQYSDRESKQNQGKVGTFTIDDLNEKIVTAIKGLKTGGISEPIVDEVGVMILRVDERTAESASTSFDESAVRSALTSERFTAERKKYLVKMRGEAYIKINESYKEAVSKALANSEVSSN